MNAIRRTLFIISRPLLIGAAIASYLIVDDRLIRPIHARGWAQMPLGFLNSLASLLHWPALQLAKKTVPRVGLSMWMPAMTLLSVFVLYTCMAFAPAVLRGVWRWMCCMETPGGASPRAECPDLRQSSSAAATQRPGQAPQSDAVKPSRRNPVRHSVCRPAGRREKNRE